MNEERTDNLTPAERLELWRAQARILERINKRRELSRPGQTPRPRLAIVWPSSDPDEDGAQ